MKKKILAAVLAATMVASLVLTGCGGSKDGASSSAGNEANTGAENSSEAESGTEAENGTEEFGNYSLVTNDFGAGEYSLDINSWIIQDVCENLGMSVDIADNEFTVDKIVTQLQNQLSQQPDGVVMIGIAETVYASVSKLCKEANTPYVFFATTPTEADRTTFEEDPLYVGTVVFDPEAEGALLAEKALEAGCKKAVICAGSEGDYNHDHRVIGFTAAFEAGGGEVLGVARCTDPSEGVTKASDLLSANMEADCAYGCGAGYITAFESVASNLGLDYNIYGSDVTADNVKDVAEGKVQAITGGANITAAFATILMINYLDGHPILDENGKAPFNSEDLSLFLVTEENAEAFVEYWPENAVKTLSLDDMKNVLYRYNPDVTYADFCELMQNYADIVYGKLP